MLSDHVQAMMNMQKFKRGLSVFSDETFKHTLTTETAAPVLNDKELSMQLQKVLFSGANLGEGPPKSIIHNQSINFDS